MEQFIKTYHSYTDDTVNKEIAKMTQDGWIVRQFEYSSQIINEKVRNCLILLYERTETHNYR